MLDGARRGYMEGWQVASLLTCLPTCEQVVALAYATLADLKRLGYAHLEPEHDFLSQFVSGLLSFLLQHRAQER